MLSQECNTGQLGASASSWGQAVLGHAAVPGACHTVVTQWVWLPQVWGAQRKEEVGRPVLDKKT